MLVGVHMFEYGRSTRELSVSCIYPLPSSQVRVWPVGCNLSNRYNPTIPPTPPLHTQTPPPHSVTLVGKTHPMSLWILKKMQNCFS